MLQIVSRFQHYKHRQKRKLSKWCVALARRSSSEHEHTDLNKLSFATISDVLKPFSIRQRRIIDKHNPKPYCDGGESTADRKRAQSSAQTSFWLARELACRAGALSACVGRARLCAGLRASLVTQNVLLRDGNSPVAFSLGHPPLMVASLLCFISVAPLPLSSV